VTSARADEARGASADACPWAELGLHGGAGLWEPCEGALAHGGAVLCHRCEWLWPLGVAACGRGSGLGEARRANGAPERSPRGASSR